MYFLKNKVFTYFLLILAVIAGFRSILSTPKELYPEIKIPVVVVSTIYPGASAKDIESTLTNVLEDALVGSLKNVDTIASKSQEGFSLITIQFKDDANITESMVDVQDKVNEKKSELPSDAQEPLVKKINFSDAPIFSFALSSTEAFTQLRDKAEIIKKRISKIQGVSEVTISGVGEREINIILSPEKLTQYNIDPRQVIAALQNAEKTFPAGSFILDDRHYRISYETNIHTADDLLQVVVGSSSGRNIYISDLTVRVEDGLESATKIARVGDPQSEFSQQAILFDVKKQAGGNIIDLTQAIRDDLAQYQKENSKEELNLITVFDAGEQIKDNLNDLVGSGFQTIILILVVMGFMVGLRDAIIAAISVPLSFLLSFIGMRFFGITINFITLFSLILVIGILIDSAVVVVEGINRELEKGKKFFEAASHTLGEYTKPIVAGVLTTIAIFIPLMALSGTLGQFIGGIPRVIIIVLVMSLVAALIFIPAIAGFIYSFNFKEPKWVVKKRETFFTKVELWYEEFLGKLLKNSRRKYQIAIVLVLLFISSFMLVRFGLIKSEFFTADEIDQAYVNIELQQGTVLEQSSETVKKIDKLIRTESSVKNTTTVVGLENSFVGGGRSGSHYAHIIINLKDKKKGRAAVEDIRKLLDQKIEGVKVQVLVPESGPPVGAPFQVEVTGSDWETIDHTAEELAAFVKTLPQARNVNSGVDVGATEIKLEIQHERLVEYGLSALDISSRLRTALYGTKAISLNPKSEGDIDVMVKLALNPDLLSHDKNNYINFDQIKNIPIQTKKGSVLLGYFIKEHISPTTSVAEHEDGKKIKIVSAYINEGFLPVDLVQSFEKGRSQLHIPDGINLKLAGSKEESQKASSELVIALGFGLLLIFGVLVWQFGSLRSVFFILSVVPLGLIGVLYGLFFTGITLSFTAMLGFIALVGVVVNNSIILIDVMNNLRNKQPMYSRVDIALAGAKQRLRPILLTTATTVLGMVPLLTVSPMWEPFALAMITGLSFAAILTLVLIPILYAKWGK